MFQAVHSSAIAACSKALSLVSNSDLGDFPWDPIHPATLHALNSTKKTGGELQQLTVRRNETSSSVSPADILTVGRTQLPGESQMFEPRREIPTHFAGAKRGWPLLGLFNPAKFGSWQNLGYVALFYQAWDREIFVDATDKYGHRPLHMRRSSPA
ncbi:hypothetical protein Bbelb_112160 [Branchiostoma belcheri]|nr:hypothetical protein Bbelb_112160 [Branchiostoma belcheri]